MPAEPSKRPSSFRRGLGIGIAAVMVSGLIVATQVSRETEYDGDRSVATEDPRLYDTVDLFDSRVVDEGGGWEEPVHTSWPAAGVANFALPGVGANSGRLGDAVSTTVGGLPVGVAAVSDDAPDQVRVEVLDESQARDLGLNGPAVTIDADDSGTVDVSFDYSSFRQLYGAEWGARLGVMLLPSCAVVDPDEAGCDGADRLTVDNDRTNHVMTVRLDLDESVTVLGLAASEQSEEGDYRATDLQASGSWTGGGSSGGFSYSNPLRLPPAEGPIPELALSYSSQGVDGRMAGANNQASWVGDGWSYSPGFIERTYVGCADDTKAQDGGDPNNKDNETGDQCWKGDSPNVTVSLNGTSTTLIKDDATGTWRAADDGNWRVRLLGSPATSSTATTERWEITTPDGTQYFFGGEAASSSSRWTVPVFGNHPGESCRAASFKNSSCDQAWRWQLDKAVDTSGNMVRYYYETETGHYGAARDETNRVSYTRGGWLKRIEYGLHTAYPEIAATARVVFAVGDRCLTSDCFEGGKPKASKWPDVPWDKDCATSPCTEQQAPVFFTSKLLSKVITQVHNGSTFTDVESWSLTHEFKAANVESSASLWLKQIIHAGHVGGTVTEPPVVFTGVELANRADAAQGAPIFTRWRIQNIRTESGADIHVTYSSPACSRDNLPAKPENNSTRCYPVYWTPDGYTEPQLDWFHKYVVTEVSEIDRTADQPAIVTRYEYSTSGGGTSQLWAWDDSEFTQKKHRTYGQWRGYAQVTTRVGESGDVDPLTTRVRYFRGMDGQRLPSGTRSVQVTDAMGNTYADHPALTGATLETARLDGTTLVETETSQYWTKQTASRSHDGGRERAYLSEPSVQTKRKLLAPGAWQESKMEISYNAEGLPVTASDLGDLSISGDETCTTTEYATSDPQWIRNAVSEVEVVGALCGAAVSRPDDVISHTKTYYDGLATHGAAPTKGLPTQEDTLDSWDGGPVFVTTLKAEHDDLGRQTSVTDPLGAVTTTTYTPAGAGPVASTVTTNPLGHQVTTHQNPAWVEPTLIIDANGKRTELSHDPLGRLAKVWLPGRSKANQTPNLEFSYQIRNDGPLSVVSRRLGPNGGYITEVGLFDSLYRSVQTQTDALGGHRLVETTGYNDRGQVAYDSGPNYADGAPGNTLLAVTPGEDRARTVSTYDALGRVVNEALWAKNVELWSTQSSYGGDPTAWQVSVTPPEGETATVTLSDARGQVVELRQFHGPTPVGDYDATRYTYSPAGALTSTTDEMGNVWRYEHDLRGREVRVDDPDKGIAVIEYDAADQVVSSTDALGQTITTEYDPLGRQVKRYFGSELVAESVYDTRMKGHVTKTTTYVDGAAFVHEIFAYDNHYNIVDEETRIPAALGLESLAGTYYTTRSYGPDGSISRERKFRAGGLEAEQVGYTYDDLGNAISVKGTSLPSGTIRTYVDTATFSPYGELRERTLGDSRRTYQIYEYDEVTRRLSGFILDRDGSIDNVAKLSYEYDAAGNVLSMANVPENADGTPRADRVDVQCYQYDHLRRLTQAWSQASTGCATTPDDSHVGGPAPYRTSYTYDPSGSRTSVTRHHASGDLVSEYAYPQVGTGQAHAPTTVTTGEQVNHYDWDAVGNLTYRMVDGTSETLTWSAQGKLTTIEGPDGTTTIVYDVNGNRIARIDPNGDATLFIGGQEVTYNTATGSVSAVRYYDHAGDTIASRTDGGDIIWLASDQHDSALWTVNAVTGVETIKYQDPFGNPRGTPPGSWPSGQRGFVGGTEDPNGLTLLGARYYDPTLGAFISVDPETDEYDPQRMHPYAYANNNPATFADPDGLFWGAITNAVSNVASTVGNAVVNVGKAAIKHAGTIASVAGTVATVAAILPPPAQVVAAVAGSVAAIAGAVDTANNCWQANIIDCGVGIASMIPVVRGVSGAVKAAKNVKSQLDRQKRWASVTKRTMPDPKAGSQALTRYKQLINKSKKVEDLILNLTKEQRKIRKDILFLQLKEYRPSWMNSMDEFLKWEGHAWDLCSKVIGACGNNRYSWDGFDSPPGGNTDKPAPDTESGGNSGRTNGGVGGRGHMYFF